MPVDSVLAIIFAVTAPVFCFLIIFGSDIFSYFESKRRDKLRMKEIDLEIARTHAGMKNNLKIQPQVLDGNSIHSKSKVSSFKIIISLLSIVVAIVIPLVIKYC